jgi:hypothetical protein
MAAQIPLGRKIHNVISMSRSVSGLPLVCAVRAQGVVLTLRAALWHNGAPTPLCRTSQPATS